MTKTDAETIAAIRARHETTTKLEGEIPLTTFEGNRDDCEAVWRLPAHAARVLCELRNAVPKLLADIGYLLAAIAERDTAAAKGERLGIKKCIAVVKSHLPYSTDRGMCNALIEEFDAIADDVTTDSIARGKGGA